MLFETELLVAQRMSGRVIVGDPEIITITENGIKREPRIKSFWTAIKFIMDKTDLVPVGQPQQIGAKSYFTTYRHTYQKPGCHIQSRHNRWAAAYPVEDHWMVKKAGVDIETRYESAQEARRAVDDWCGTVPDLKELRKEGMVGEYLSAEQICAKKPQVEEMSALQCYDELDRLTSYRRSNGRGRNPDAYQARHYCKIMRGRVKARLKELGVPLTRPGETKVYGPGMAKWQKGKGK